MALNSENEIDLKIQQLNKIFKIFLEEIKPLEKEQDEIIKRILERMDKKKMEEIKKTLDKLFLK